MAEFETVIRGDVVVPERVIPGASIGISDGRISKISASETLTGHRVVDATDCYVLPGAVDGQVHAYSQADREGIIIATRAAAAGGVTTIVDMPYDEPQPINNAELFRRKVEVVGEEAHVDVALYATMAKEGGVADLKPLIEAGACAFKFSMCESHPIRFPRIAMGDMLDAFTTVAPSGLACGVHNENQEIVDTCIARLSKEMPNDPRVHGLSRPPVSESMAIGEVYELGLASGCRAHIVHCSIGHGIDLCTYYKGRGAKASIEVCLHYLVFNEDELLTQGAKAKINPPLRPQAEVERLWDCLRAGEIDFVSTDHVAWSLDHKSNPEFLKNKSGVPGLEALVPVFFTECVKRGFEITTIARMLSEQPAKHFLLYPQKGAIHVGSDADLIILEKSEGTIDSARWQSAAEWSPYDGRQVLGRVAATYVRGVEVWDGSSIKVEPGFGRFLRPNREGASHAA